MIKDLLDEQTELRHFLFIRGFLVTTDNKIESNLYPFYGKWNVHSFGKLQIWTHPSTEFNCVEKEGDICFLIGHAYNPFTMEFHEEDNNG